MKTPLVALLISGIFTSCTTNKLLSEKAVESLMAKRVTAYFANIEKKNDPISCEECNNLTKDQVNQLHKFILTTAKRDAEKNGKLEQFNKRVMIFDNPFGLDEKCPMQFTISTKGEKPKNGWPVYINIHGSGPVDREYKIHQKRHKYYSGMLVVPRSPNDVTTTPAMKKGGIWRHWYIPAIEQLVSELVMFADADPNKIYIMGFSEGGYFSYRVIPEMSDRLAGVAPAAGGGVAGKWVDNLVNIPFYAQSGEKDDGYGRAKTFRDMVTNVKDAEKKYPGMIQCRLVEHKGRFHQIPDIAKKYSAPLWLEKFTRDPFPKFIIWQQKKDVECYILRTEKKGFTYPYVSKSHYWLKVDPLLANFARIEASYKNNTIKLNSKEYDTITVRLNDKMVDLSKKVKIFFNGKKVYEKIPTRKLNTMLKTWQERQDPEFIFPVEITASSI